MIPADVFSASTTTHLRNFLVANCPRKGASRLPRAGLVTLLLDTMSDDEIASLERAARIPLPDIPSVVKFLPGVHRQMSDRYGAFFASYLHSPFRRNHPRLGTVVAFSDPMHEDVSDAAEDIPWPQPVSPSVIDSCVQDFTEHTAIAVAETCAVCGRRTFSQDILFTVRHLTCQRLPAVTLDLTILEVTDPHILQRPAHHFEYGDPSLTGLALHKDGVHVHDGLAELDICCDCHSALTSSPPKLPPLALANDNIRGYLPAHLQDVTWLEERLCAKYLASAYIVRLYDLTAPGAVEERPRVMKGHACSFPLNTVSTATKLPWAVDGNAALLSCIVIGPRKPRTQDLRNVFKVRRNKVRDLLLYLREHCKGYPDFSFDEDALGSLPDDDVPELIMRHVIYESNNEVPSLFARETAGLDVHPAVLGEDEDEDPQARTFLEHHGLLDINGISVPAHSRSASALANATGTERPDLIIRHGATFVEDYNNPELFPGMFPTLFPWGTGGFEQKPRRVPLSFGRQAKYLLDVTESNFRRHWSFIFIVANIRQRRAIHLGSRLMCQSQDFDRFTNLLRRLDPSIVRRVSDHVARGGSLKTLSGDESQIFALLKKCELVSANVPGSKAVMTRARADIRAYIGKFGIFQLFLTLNPGPSHSPVFQIFFGDQSVTLDTRSPTLPTSKARAARVADDPVAASDYFHFHINAVFQYLLGWDIRKRKSTPKGGLFGHVAAFYLVKEHSMRGQLHCHSLIWLKGGVNPATLRARMHDDEEFRDRYLQFFDSLLMHGYPDSDVQQEGPQPTHRKPRQERPPHPTDADYVEQFNGDHSLLAHEVQRHRCTFTCFKGGRDSCRFLFPHEVVNESSFDPETNSINLRVQHPLINWHNPALLVATRHNHDLKAVQSGKSGAAAASYITSYTTKSEETPANQISMINTVYERLAKTTDTAPDTRSLLSKCVMQFGRERQVHAQQAATYVRELGDTEYSHDTVPMLSGRLTATVHQLFGPPRDLEAATLPPAPSPTSCPTVAANTGTGTGPSAERMDVDGCGPIPPTLPEPDVPGEELASADGDLLPLNHRGLAHQVQDYILRGESLGTLCFYDFVQHVRLVRIPKSRNKTHHALPKGHPNHGSHVHRYTPLRSLGIPRSIGSSFPRPDGSEGHGDFYCSAMMAHFIPFCNDYPLKERSIDWESAFAQTTFSPAAVQIMDNWAALSECDDARDADQLRRRRKEAQSSSQVDAKMADLGTAHDSSTADVEMEDLHSARERPSAETITFATTLEQGGWFNVGNDAATSSVLPSSPDIDFSRSTRRTWAAEQSQLEAKAKADLSVPTASHGILADQLMFDDGSAEDLPTLDRTAVLVNLPAPPTERLHWRDREPHDLLAALVSERQLTPSQSLAFNIAGRRFFEQLHAGTGKTVVVRLLRELMDRFGKGSQIKFLAPTGKAASAIGGMTQHAAFGIEVHRRGMTTEEQQLSQRDNHAKRMRFLQSAFGHVRWLFFDEVSMTSCEVFGEIDQALRIATQRLDEPFGGINVIFAGDLCQLPPVGAAPLYTKASRTSQSGTTRTKVELGRFSWLYVQDVVEFTEQMRMTDGEMAEALTRLRTRNCVDADAALFNTNVMRGTGTSSSSARQDMIVLASTNQTVRTLNERKASSQAAAVSRHLATSHAMDNTDVAMDKKTRSALLCYNGRGDTKVGMGRMPLFVGMPIVYRGPNQSVPLGITNGAFGTIAGWKLQEDRLGFTTPTAAIVQFDNTATWSLSGLDRGCLPIYPTSSTFTFALHNDTTAVRRISRRQLPLQPGFAMTVHSAQGITCKSGVVVDLRKGGFPAYVAASRATRREDIHLIAEVTTAQLNSPALPLSLRDELKRLRVLASVTSDAHSGTTWRLRHPRQPSPGTSSEDPPSKRSRLS
ncbi:hypothetical protein A4X13_0g4891 [Tilletia indica]|uniref:ATP-dependent DNA helicase n=1 Tax=Tilletia indica TaxID=43049 RepID=A0A177TP93_9BASI|nr:hypothetical protein A4X13_0g4891 [Tilletia indica]